MASTRRRHCFNLSIFCAIGLCFFLQEAPGWVPTITSHRSKWGFISGGPFRGITTCRKVGESSPSANDSWERRILHGPHPLSERARRRRRPPPPPSAPPQSRHHGREGDLGGNGTAGAGSRAMLNEALVQAAKEEDYQKVLDLIYDDLKRANGVNLATAVIRLARVDSNRLRDLVVGSRNGRRFDALMMAMRNKLSTLRDNNVANVLVALSDMVEVYTPQEDLLRELKVVLLERIPGEMGLDGKNMRKVVTSIRELLLAEERPRRVFDSKFKEVLLNGLSRYLPMETDATSLRHLISGPATFVERGQPGLASFMDEASAAVVRTVGTMSVQDLAKITNAFARYGDICGYKLSHGTLDLLARESIIKLPEFRSTAEVSLLLHSMARCFDHGGKGAPKALFTTYESVTSDQLHKFQAQHLSITINTMSLAGHYPSPAYLTKVMVAAEDKLERGEFTDQALSKLLSGISAFLGRDFHPSDSLFDECTRVLTKEKLTALSPRHLSTIIQALGKASEFLKWRPSLSWLASAVQAARRRLPECRSREVAALVHGLSMYDVSTPDYGDLLDDLQRRQSLLADSTITETSSILLGLSKLNFRPDETMLRLLARLVIGGDTGGGGVASSSSQPAKEWTGRIMANALTGFAKLDWMPPMALWEVAVEKVHHADEGIPIQHLASILWSLAVLDAPFRAVTTTGGDGGGDGDGGSSQKLRHLWGALIDQVVAALHNKDASPGDLRQLWQVICYIERIHPDELSTAGSAALRAILEERCSGSTSTFEEDLEANSAPLRTSVLQKQVLAVIDDLLGGHTQQEVSEGYIYTLDILVLPRHDHHSSPSSASAPALPVVVEVDGPSHFFLNDQERPNGRTLHKRRLLQADIGTRWSAVVPVSYSEWEELEGEEERVAFMLQRFRSAGVTDLDAYFERSDDVGLRDIGTGHQAHEQAEEEPRRLAGAVEGSAEEEEGRRARLMSMTVKDLKEECRGEGLLVGGTKAQLVERLMATMVKGGRQEEEQVIPSASSSPSSPTRGPAVAPSPPSQAAPAAPAAPAPPAEAPSAAVVVGELSSTSSSPPSPSPSSSVVVNEVFSLMGFKVAELKDMCRDMGLGVGGDKRALIERIVDHRIKGN